MSIPKDPWSRYGEGSFYLSLSLFVTSTSVLVLHFTRVDLQRWLKRWRGGDLHRCKDGLLVVLYQTGRNSLKLNLQV